MVIVIYDLLFLSFRASAGVTGWSINYWSSWMLTYYILTEQLCCANISAELFTDTLGVTLMSWLGSLKYSIAANNTLWKSRSKANFLTSETIRPLNSIFRLYSIISLIKQSPSCFDLPKKAHNRLLSMMVYDCGWTKNLFINFHQNSSIWSKAFD